MVHINNPYGIFEEKNPFVKEIVESSPISFTLLYLLVTLYFFALLSVIKILEEKVRKPIAKIVLIILILVKVVALFNNFYVMFIVYK